MATRVLLADDHPVYREGLAGLIDVCDDMVVVGQASDGAAALALCRTDPMRARSLLRDPTATTRLRAAHTGSKRPGCASRLARAWSSRTCACRCAAARSSACSGRTARAIPRVVFDATTSR